MAEFKYEIIEYRVIEIKFVDYFSCFAHNIM